MSLKAQQIHSHAVVVHRLSEVEFVVLEVGADDLGEVGLDLGLDGLDLIITLSLLLQLRDNALQVCLELRGVVLLAAVKRSARVLVAEVLQTEGVDDVVDLSDLVIGTLLVAALGRGVSTDIERFTADVDHGAVDFVDDIVDVLEVVRVGDDLVAGDEVLERKSAKFVAKKPLVESQALPREKRRNRAAVFFRRATYSEDNHFEGKE